MDNTIFLQKQVRDNSEDLRSYIKDLEQWEENMKRKESDLHDNKDILTVPIPRNKAQKIVKEVKEVEEEKPKIKACDYAAWEKFDVEAECEKVDTEEKDEKEEEEMELKSNFELQKRMKDEALYEKERGNQFVKNRKWDEAISCYTRSISCDSTDPIFFANRALCFLKKNDLKSADADCTSALLLNDSYVKALQRRAVAKEGLKQYQEALDDLYKVLELEPHNKETKKELDRLEKRLGIRRLEPKKLNEPENKKIITTPLIDPVAKEQPKSEPDDVQKKIIPTPIIISKEQPKSESADDQKKIISTPIIIPTTKEQPKPKPVDENDQKEVQKSPKIPWPERPNSEIIIPVQKPPHQRSKKPLHRIEMIETDDSILKLNTSAEKTKISNLKIDYNDSNALANILAQTQQLDIDEILKDLPKSNLKDVKFDYPIPKSSVQFYTNWKIIKDNLHHRFLYLQQINPEELPNIFKDFLESEIFSDFITVLREKFIAENLPVYNYLLHLSKVKRFSTLTLFFSSKDKQGLKILFNYCETIEKVAKNELASLYLKYEL